MAATGAARALRASSPSSHVHSQDGDQNAKGTKKGGSEQTYDWPTSEDVAAARSRRRASPIERGRVPSPRQRQSSPCRVSRPWSSFDGGASWQTLPVELHRTAEREMLNGSGSGGGGGARVSSPDSGIGSMSKFGRMLSPPVAEGLGGGGRGGAGFSRGLAGLQSRARNPGGSPGRDAARAHSPGYSGFELQLNTAALGQCGIRLLGRLNDTFHRPNNPGNELPSYVRTGPIGPN